MQRHISTAAVIRLTPLELLSELFMLFHSLREQTSPRQLVAIIAPFCNTTHPLVGCQRVIAPRIDVSHHSNQSDRGGLSTCSNDPNNDIPTSCFPS